nr:ester cyclase [uncultured Campylobacter sp.]
MKRRNFIKFGAVAAIAPIVSSAKTTHEDKIERNKAAMKRFETAINTADEALLNELVDPEAPFVTPASKDPLYGGSGYNAIVQMMRTSFPDVQWAMQDMVADERCAAVYWLCSGTHKQDFMGIAPTGRKFSARVMNFYYFNERGKIVNDVAAEGMIAILRAIGACDK